jgi:hypothetical protein
MILLAGIAEESPLALVTEALEAMGADHRVFDQRRVAGANIALEIADAAGGGAIEGTLTFDDASIPLSAITAIYVRLMDDQFLPGIAALPPHSAGRVHCRRFHELLLRFADIAPGRVLNRPTDAGSNHSKPYQAQAIRAAGFDIPDTLITNDPQAAREFIEHAWSEGGGAIYKSVSGVRSIVRRVETTDLARLDRIRWCPDAVPAPRRRHRHPGARRRRNRAGGKDRERCHLTIATPRAIPASSRRLSGASSTHASTPGAWSSPHTCAYRSPASTCGARRTSATCASR